MAKTNEKRRQRNWMLRVVRGNRKAGNPLPGHSRVYAESTLDAAYVAHGESLRSRVDDALGAYWLEGARSPRAKQSTNRWF